MRPILFNTEMVRAILEGRKTVTRRVVKPQPRMVYYDGILQDSGDDVCEDVPELVLIAEDRNGVVEQIVPPFRPSDILYVRETWNREPFNYDRFIYRADGCYGPGMPWRPSVHMPREAARLFLRVTDVRVEQLQEICGGDLLKEGIDLYQSNFVRVSFKEFEDLWDSTIKSADRALYGWEANPWVWVIEFERYKNRRRCDDGISEKDLFMGS